MVADVCIDPTSSPYGADFLTLHVPYMFARMSARDVNAERALKAATYIAHDTSYAPVWEFE